MGKTYAILLGVFLASLMALSIDLPLVRAELIVVPDNYTNIQAAINAANAHASRIITRIFHKYEKSGKLVTRNSC